MRPQGGAKLRDGDKVWVSGDDFGGGHGVWFEWIYDPSCRSELVLKFAGWLTRREAFGYFGEYEVYTNPKCIIEQLIADGSWQ